MNSVIRQLAILFGIIISTIMIIIFHQFIGSLTLGVFIYYSTRPVYDELVDRDINKTIAAAISPVLFLIPILILILYTLRIVTVEARALVIQASGSIFSFVEPDMIEQLLNKELALMLPELDMLTQLNPAEIIGIVQNVDSNVFDSFLDYGLQFGIAALSSLSGVFFTLLISFSLAFYLLRDGHHLKSKLYDLTSYNKTITEFSKKLDADLEIVFFGNILLAIFTAIIGAISFSLITIFVPGGNILAYPALIGIFCGVTSLIPVIGMKLVYWPVTLIIAAIGLLEGGISGLLFPFVFFIVGLILVDTIPDFVARPYISSRGGISTGVIFFSYVLGPLAFGWYGLFLGPLIFVIAYEFIKIILPSIANDMGI
jgi:Predicted permease